MKRFFCENCGNEVDEADDICRYCGAFFVAIKCPQCGFRGKQHHFRRGCPVCGFLGEEGPVRFTETHEGTSSLFPEPEITRKESRFARARRPVPEWVFWLALAGMVIAFAVLSLVYLRL